MEIPTPPAAVTFDCWGTLINDLSWEGAVEARVASLVEIAAGRDVDLEAERARELIEGSWQQHVQAWRKGELYGPQGASRWCLTQLGIDDQALADELAEAIGTSTSRLGTRVIEGAPDALRAVRDAGIPTALICDTGFTPGSQVRKFLAEHGLELDHYFFSDEVGAPKPYPVIFEAALKATGADAEKSIHIGDLRRTDVAGARGVGMATIRFTGVHDDGWDTEESQGEEADAVLKGWSELPGLIGL
ncbi:MAG: HAD family hydrolase [Actinobacteria bacterium]|nr:HAD family hydrolase [Actinomycetota bacterium]